MLFRLEIKLIDFGSAQTPERNEEIAFQLGLLADISKITRSFVKWVLYPNPVLVRNTFTPPQETMITHVSKELSPI